MLKDWSAFAATLDAAEPPALPLPLHALWWDRKGDWHQAHEAAQAAKGQHGDWVHAYLHRKEGDLANAAYWYARARKPEPSGTPDAEWDAIARALLANG
jgi:hypothetical protein